MLLAGDDVLLSWVWCKADARQMSYTVRKVASHLLNNHLLDTTICGSVLYITFTVKQEGRCHYFRDFQRRWRMTFSVRNDELEGSLRFGDKIGINLWADSAVRWKTMRLFSHPDCFDTFVTP